MSITVLLLIALCLLCVVVFLKHKKTERFYEQSCPSIECPYGTTSKHIVFSGTPQEKMACCSNSINGIGQYFDGKECKSCELEFGTENSNYLTGKSRTSNCTTTKNSTIASCKAECKMGNWIEHIAATPGTGWFESPTFNAYPTSNCEKSVAYSNVHQNPQTSPYSNLTVQYRTADSNAPNFENSWCSSNSYSNNNSNYCCTDSNIPRYNDASPNDLGCCASNEYLSDAGSCSLCPNGGLCSNDLNQSGILCCSISNCKLSNSPPSTLDTERDALWSVGNTYYSNNTAVTNIDNYGCYAHYQYNKLSDIAVNGSNIVSLSNTVYFDGSNYHYLDEDQNVTSNNIIKTTNIRESNESNWFYHHDSNNNAISTDIHIPEREYIPSDDYSKYYKCDTNTFLRCLQSTQSDTPCGCCPSTQYWDGSNCLAVETTTDSIADNQLYSVNLENCLSGYGKKNFDGLNGTSNQCTKCSNLVYYHSLDDDDNRCRACPNEQYPNSMDMKDSLNTHCSNAPSLTFGADWYRFEYTDASANPTTYYLTYSSNQSNYSIFKKVTNTKFTYNNNSNIYLWSNATDSVQIQLPTTTYKSGQFLNIDAPSILSSGHYNTRAVFQPIPYCEPGKYASNLECASCASNEYSSSYGAKECSNCPSNSGTGGQTGKSSSHDCMCPAGYYYNTLVSPPQCKECPVNKWCPGGSIGGEGLCNYACPSNSVTNEGGKSNRDQCECKPGEYYHASQDSFGCQECGWNTYCPGGSITKDEVGCDWIACPLNAITNQRGSSNKDDCVCQSGETYTPDETECLCDGGFYRVTTPTSSTCTPVGFGYYSPNQNDNRVECPRNSSTSIDNASNVSQCTCDGGSYFYEATCLPVGSDYWSPNLDNDRYQCPDNSSTGRYTVNASHVNQCICDSEYTGPRGGPCTAAPPPPSPSPSPDCATSSRGPTC